MVTNGTLRFNDIPPIGLGCSWDAIGMTLGALGEENATFYRNSCTNSTLAKSRFSYAFLCAKWTSQFDMYFCNQSSLFRPPKGLRSAIGPIKHEGNQQVAFDM